MGFLWLASTQENTTVMYHAIMTSLGMLFILWLTLILSNIIGFISIKTPGTKANYFKVSEQSVKSKYL